MEYSKQKMGLPFNIREVATTVTWLVLYDSSSLSYFCVSPVPTNPAEPQSLILGTELDSGDTEEAKPWSCYKGAHRLGMKLGTVKVSLQYNMIEERLNHSRQSSSL